MNVVLAAYHYPGALPALSRWKEIKLMILFTFAVLYTFGAACEKMIHTHHPLLACITTSLSGSLVHTDSVHSAWPNNLEFACSPKSSFTKWFSAII